MKPRLEASPPTEEDFAAWVALARRQHVQVFGIAGLCWCSLESDRRDADLMLKFRVQHAPVNQANMLFWATWGLPYWDIEAIIAGWLG